MKQDARTIRKVFFSAVLVLLTIPILLYLGIQNFIDSYNWVNHTWEVQYKVQRFFSELKQSESAGRAYLLTGDSTYLAEKKRFQAALPQYTSELKVLISDNPKQVANMNLLDSLAHVRLARLDSTIGLFRNGTPLPVLQLRMAGGRRMMSTAEQVANNMFQEEWRLLARRQNARDRYVRILPIYLVALTLVLLVVIVFIFLSLQRQLKTRDQMQGQLEARNRDLLEQKKVLEDTNEELESFNFIASHDLKEPLRKILTFSSMIQKQELGQLSERGQFNLQRLVAAAERMRTLLEDLLAYTRLRSEVDLFVPVDMNAVVKQVQENLHEQIVQSQAQVNVQHLPTINGIPFQLHQLFENLLSNALKYHKKGIAPQISITCGTVAGADMPCQNQIHDKNYYRISITDNGLGFPQEYAHKLFQLFSRLHNNNKIAGTGIGLTICKKVVDNHHGFITAEGKVNEGATFHVFLPQ